MKTLFYASVVVGLLLIGASWFVLPDRVASHFGPDGKADGQSGKTELVVILAATLVFVAATFAVCPLFPPQWFNVPNSAYWKRPENLPQMKRKVEPFLYEMGVFTNLFFVALMFAIVVANRSDPPVLPASFWVSFGGFIVYTVLWVLRLFLAFRVPKDSGHNP